ncbi:hypothetical protein F2P81_005566 [Scophthalmus maximus]|uniref:Tctex1 domain-containing protein 2 n=1 Tax=Scophthalmus maximus TaxID=52904 RepID=A0A6A4TFN6_SCOMX|nr:hypothetical protein F2P81_005566 [Scophthalmus maximus]
MEVSATYLIRPSHQHKFKPARVKECIREVVRERLSGVQYDPEEVPELSRSLADCIKDKVKNAGFDRYKLVVQVAIGEQRGQGVKTACSVWWQFLGAITTEDDTMDDRNLSDGRIRMQRIHGYFFKALKTRYRTLLI